jgi:hypothetical protein
MEQRQHNITKNNTQPRTKQKEFARGERCLPLPTNDSNEDKGYSNATFTHHTT